MAWRRTWLLPILAMAAWATPSTASAERVVFINTEPVVLTNSNGQDPTTNSYNTTGFSPGPASGWPGLTADQQEELLFWLKEGTVPFNVIYTFERPMSGSYDMIVMGDAADNAALFPGLGCSGAIGLADCSDSNAENISFLFWGCLNAGDQADMHRVAFTTYAALGFGWGLENLAVSGQIMGTYTANALHFGESCAAISGMQLCAGQHVGCADPTQNSTADLLARIGPRIDDGPPFVQITSPANNTVVPPDIEVTAVVGDLFGGVTVELEIVEAMQQVIDERPPYGWSLTNIPQGTWTLRVTATDADMNIVSEEVQICVDLPECGGGTGGDSTGGDSTTGDGTTGDGEPETTTGASTGEPEPEPDPPSLTTGPPPPTPTPLGGDEPETGCQCRAAPGGTGAWGGSAMMLLLLGAMRRRDRLTRRG